MALTIKEKIRVLEKLEEIYEFVDYKVDKAKNSYKAYSRALLEEPENEKYKEWVEEAKKEREAWEIAREKIEEIGI